MTATSDRHAGIRLAAAAVAAACAPLPPPAPTAPSGPSPLERARRAVVSVRVTGQDYDWRTPWSKLSPWTRFINGVVVGERSLLTTGDNLGNQTLIEVQRLGDPQRFPARLKRVDYELPLALIEVDDAAFWEGLAPLPIAPRVPTEGDVQVHRWLASGQFEAARATVRQVRSGTHGLSRTGVLTIDLSSTLDRAGWGEVVVGDGALIGLSTSKSGEMLAAIAAPVLAQFVAAASEEPYRGVARGGFTWQRLTNPALRAHLGLTAAESGVRVDRVLPHGSAAGVLLPGDVLLAIAGVALDNSGYFDHPAYGKVLFDLLFTTGPRPGETVEVRMARGGERKTVSITLRRIAPEDERAPPYSFDRQPDNAVFGGLVFQHLTGPYLSTWGNWRAAAPMRLLIAYDREGIWPTPQQPRVVILTQVLPDPANLGYQELRDHIVTAVNGRPARTLDEVRAAFNQPAGRYHVVEFLAGQATQRIVLDAEEVKAAEPRVKALYGL